MKTIIASICFLCALALFGAPPVSKDEEAVAVMGAVNHAGMVKVEGKIGLVEAIKKAEGFSKYADKKGVKVMSGGMKGAATYYDVEKIIAGSMKEPTLAPGDVVLVPEVKL